MEAQEAAKRVGKVPAVRNPAPGSASGAFFVCVVIKIMVLVWVLGII